MAGALALPSFAATQITGAGSTFDYPILTKWFRAYGQANPGVEFNYQSIGSGGGIKALFDQTVDFGASDAYLKDDKLSESPNGPVLQIPVVAGAVVVSYNLPGVAKLKLDGAAIAGIYLGEIKKWNDPVITKLNPGVLLPAKDVIVVHRSDGSGTSFIFTDYLSHVSSTWAAKVGCNTTVKWPVGIGGKGNDGVAGMIRQLPGAVGYVELAYAMQTQLPYADQINKAGKTVTATTDSVSAAMATAMIPDDFRFSMVDAPGDGAWPIAGASWVLIYQNAKDPAKGKIIRDFLKWCVSKGQESSVALHYAALPDKLQLRILKVLSDSK
jgi:phosphate transport system substrate-binding protein